MICTCHCVCVCVCLYRSVCKLLDNYEVIIGKTMEALNCCSAAQSCPTLCNPVTVAHQAPPWDFSDKNTRVCCHFLLQGIFPTQGSNMLLLYWQVDSLPLSHQGSPSDVYLYSVSNYCLHSHITSLMMFPDYSTKTPPWNTVEVWTLW